MKRSGFRQQSVEEIKEKQAIKRKKLQSVAKKPKTPLKAKNKPLRARSKPKAKTPRALKMAAKKKLCEQYDLPDIPCTRWGITKSYNRTTLLKGMLWTVFSKYIRERDSELPCITCNLQVDEKHAGHYAPVGGNNIEMCFDEENVNGECPTCNADFNGWHLVPMRKNLVAKYGEETVAGIDQRVSRMNTVKWEEEDFVTRIRKYLD